MEKFPKKKYLNIEDYSHEYFKFKNKILHDLNFNNLQQINDQILNCYKSGNILFSCGNGGSSSIANHFVCDHIKGVQSNTDLKPKVISLSNNIEIMTAISNDLSYEDVFSYQLDTLGNLNDILLVISSSGNSKNVVKAIKTAKSKKMKVFFNRV